MADDSQKDNIPLRYEDPEAPLRDRTGWGLAAIAIGFFGGLLTLASLVSGGFLVPLIIGGAALVGAAYCAYRVVKPYKDPQEKQFENDSKKQSKQKPEKQHEQEVELGEWKPPEPMKAPEKPPEPESEPQKPVSALTNVSASKATTPSAGRSV